MLSQTLKDNTMLELLTKDKDDILTLNLSTNDYINLNYFNALLKNSVVCKMNLKGHFAYINDKFTQVTGYTKKEIIGKSHEVLGHPNRDPKLYDELKKTIMKGKIFHERILCINKDDSDFWADATIIPLVNSQTGELIEYMCILRDITEFLAMKRKFHKQELEKKENEKISQAKDAFLILFTHELKTPLNAIINFSQYLLKHVKGNTIENVSLQKRERLLKKIESSALGMLENVTQLLELSRLRANKLNYTISPIDARESVKDVIKNHQNMAKEYGAKVSHHSTCKDHICSLSTDAFRFQQIVGNIISNAIKYGNGKVRVHTGDCGRNQWILHVEDNGSGIDDIEGAFTLFERDEKSAKSRSKEGTGIGLTFVKLLCRDLGFEYQLGKSEELGGLKFTIIKNKKVCK